jgi:hypothetical protein
MCFTAKLCQLVEWQSITEKPAKAGGANFAGQPKRRSAAFILYLAGNNGIVVMKSCEAQRESPLHLVSSEGEVQMTMPEIILESLRCVQVIHERELEPRELVSSIAG